MDYDINVHRKKPRGNNRKFIKNAIIVVLVAVGIIGLSQVFSNKDVADDTNLKSEASDLIGSQIVVNPVKLVIDYGDLQKIETELEEQEGMTALSALELAAKEYDLELDITKYDFGAMVNTIGFYEGGEDGKYWMYYVNDKTPEVGADKYQVKTGDTVEWRYEKQ